MRLRKSKSRLETGQFSQMASSTQSGRQPRTSALGSLDGTQHPHGDVLRHGVRELGANALVLQRHKDFRMTATDAKPMLSWELRLHLVKRVPSSTLDPKGLFRGPSQPGLQSTLPHGLYATSRGLVLTV